VRMLFFIDKSVADALVEDGKPEEHLVAAVHNLAQARRLGKHFVMADRETLATLGQSRWLHPRDRGVYVHLYNTLPQMGTYLNNLVRRVEVVAAEGVFESNGEQNRRVVKLSATHFDDFSIVDKAIFLCENLNEVRFYQQLTRAYLFWSGLGQVRICCDPRGGGGDTTADAYEAIRSPRNQLCLCIVDSDRTTPSDSIGNTALRVKRIDDADDQPLCELTILDVRETENLVSRTIYQETVWGDPNRMEGVLFLESLESSTYPHARRYLDMKRGLKLGEIVHAPPNSAFYKYWRPIVRDLQNEAHAICDACWSDPDCTCKQDCHCIVAPGLGDGILEDVTDYLERQSSQKVAEMVPELLKDEWENLGELITAWFCGSPRMVAV